MNAIIDEFPQPADLYYLNHAAVAPWPVSYTHLTLPTIYSV